MEDELPSPISPCDDGDLGFSITRKPIGNYLDFLSAPSLKHKASIVNEDGVSELTRNSMISIGPGIPIESYFPASITEARRESDNTTLNEEFQSIPLTDLGDGYDKSQDPDLFITDDVALIKSLHEYSEFDPSPKPSPEPHREPDYHCIDERQAKCIWLPAALRGPYLTLMTILCLGLGMLVLGLTVYSDKNNGLAIQKNDLAYFFCWRFLPTIVAVLYGLLLMPIASEVKLTECYARLSRPGGGSAAPTLFFKPRSVWLSIIDALRKPGNGQGRNWALFWSSLANIIAIIVILPFSATLLSPAEVVITTANATFSRISPMASVPMNLTIDDLVYFRSISSILTNATSSAWLSNDYSVLPFWPLDQENSYGPVLSQEAEQWTADTTVFQTTLECLPMKLKQMSNYMINSSSESSKGSSAAPSTMNLASFVLESTDGCSFGLAALQENSTATAIFDTGGGWWSAGPNFSYPNLWAPASTPADLSSAYPILLNTSAECGAERTMFIFSTPYVEGQAFEATGQICSSSYFSAVLPVTVTNTGSYSSFSFDVGLFDGAKTPVTASMLDTSLFEQSFLSQDWSSKFSFPTSDPSKLPAQIGGPLTLLAAQINFELGPMFANPVLAATASQIKQRVFGESIQSSLYHGISQQVELVSGQTAQTQERIVVSYVAGIILSVFFIFSSIIVGLVGYHTRLSRRPLNLLQDPSTTMAAASLIASDKHIQGLFEGLDRASEKTMCKQLDRYTFSLAGGVLFAHDNHENQSSLGRVSGQGAFISCPGDWRPQVIRGWFLAGLLSCLAALTGILAIIFVDFQDSGIDQSNLMRNVNIHVASFSALSLYTVVPTLIAVLIQQWWSSMDETFRRLQPFLSMIESPTTHDKGIKLSYGSYPALWALPKALRNRNFLLAVVIFGTLLTEPFTIGMAALWHRKSGVNSQSVTLTTPMELRTTPIIFSVPSIQNFSTSQGNQNRISILENIYDIFLTSWMYGAASEGSYNTTALAWTSEDWAFVPADISSVPLSANVTFGDILGLGSLANITLETPALRGRLQCTPLDMSNTSAWLTTLDFTNKTAWNDPNIPSDLTVGYELKLGISMNGAFANGTKVYWDESNPYTSFFAKDYRMTCCGNETNGIVGDAAIGYWSVGADSPDQSIIVKWITGQPFVQQFADSTADLASTPGDGYGSGMHWVWRDIPQVTALNCTPIFESTNASIVVDASSGVVQDYMLLETPMEASAAWSYNYQQVNASADLRIPGNEIMDNVTVSYGYLFHDILLGAADVARTGQAPTLVEMQSENLDDRSFNFRQPGLNTDFMSYTSLALVGHDTAALLNPETLANVSSSVFSLFFKHFMLADVTTPGTDVHMNGSWGLQPLGASIPSDLGPVTTNGRSVYLQDSFIPSNATSSGSTEALLTTRVSLLGLDTVAGVMCLGILGFLVIVTGGLLFCGLGDRYSVLLTRDVSSLGSVLGYLYSSEKLLAECEVRGTDGNTDDKAAMGWFDAHGVRRWGIELADGHGDGYWHESEEGGGELNAERKGSFLKSGYGELSRHESES